MAAPLDIISALRTLEQKLKKSSAHAELCEQVSGLAQSFEKTLRTRDNDDAMGQLRTVINEINGVISSDLLKGKEHVDELMQAFKNAVANLQNLIAREMDFKPFKQVVAYPLNFLKQDVARHSNSKIQKIIRSLYVVKVGLERLADPEKFAVNGKFSYSAVGATITVRGDIASRNHGPAKHIFDGASVDEFLSS
jgi:hypothetical protein